MVRFRMWETKFPPFCRAGAYPYPFCPFGTFPPDRGNRPSPLWPSAISPRQGESSPAVPWVISPAGGTRGWGGFAPGRGTFVEIQKYPKNLRGFGPGPHGVSDRKSVSFIRRAESDSAASPSGPPRPWVGRKQNVSATVFPRLSFLIVQPGAWTGCPAPLRAA